MLKIGAVIYDPKVTVIWDLIGKFFKEKGMEIEAHFYKDYKMQVDALLAYEIDLAWNSPLAHLDSVLRGNENFGYSLMRDTDQGRKTIMVARKGEFSAPEDLKGKVIGFGALDSPQARLIPIKYLRDHGLEFGKDYEEKRFDIGLGLHGDHVGGELDAIKALAKGEVDASFTLDLNWEAWKKDGTVDENALEKIGETGTFDHCIFDYNDKVDKADVEKFEEIMLQMDYSKEDDKKIMDMEGLKEWRKGRLSGYDEITEANKYLNFLDV